MIVFTRRIFFPLVAPRTLMIGCVKMISFDGSLNLSSPIDCATAIGVLTSSTTGDSTSFTSCNDVNH